MKGTLSLFAHEFAVLGSYMKIQIVVNLLHY